MRIGKCVQPIARVSVDTQVNIAFLLKECWRSRVGCKLGEIIHGFYEEHHDRGRGYGVVCSLAIHLE